MYNKAKCKKCKYHGKLSSIGAYCYYSVIKNEACLYRKGKETIDRRGGDPNNCLLYEKGDKVQLSL
jgi:hypothetical protein|nr:MAG TPA: hypothetical protein [Caudoviricetes sp.]